MWHMDAIKQKSDPHPKHGHWWGNLWSEVTHLDAKPEKLKSDFFFF